MSVRSGGRGVFGGDLLAQAGGAAGVFTSRCRELCHHRWSGAYARAGGAHADRRGRTYYRRPSGTSPPRAPTQAKPNFGLGAAVRPEAAKDDWR